jgi:thiol-disulfide isomerase/thioredoxin
MLGIADSSWPTPDLNNQDNQCPGKAVAAALVYARTGTTSYRTKVINALAGLPDTPVLSSSRALAWGRQLAGWAICADLIGYNDAAFKAWISGARTVTLPGHSRWTSVKDPSQPLRFSALDLHGKTVTESDPRFKGKVVLVNIMGSWCPNCHDELVVVSNCIIDTSHRSVRGYSCSGLLRAARRRGGRSCFDLYADQITGKV